MRRIALVTDFGTRDPYVAAVKGVIAARTNAPLLDLTHEIEPFDVFQVAWFLRAIVRYWPPDTIFMVVVDPGVGTSRRILALESDGRIFLAPDNGTLTFIEGRVWSVENESLFLPGGSTTFHGRDRFAPVAAALANGLSINELGRRITDPIRLEYTPPCIRPVVPAGRSWPSIDSETPSPTSKRIVSRFRTMKRASATRRSSDNRRRILVRNRSQLWGRRDASKSR
jgi:S-adenosylmethionine hydrolase